MMSLLLSEMLGDPGDSFPYPVPPWGFLKSLLK